jgi:hypothetical protein
MGEKGLMMEDMLKEPEEEEHGKCSGMGLEEVEMGEDWGALVRIRGSLEGRSRVWGTEELWGWMGPGDCRDKERMVNDKLNGLNLQGNRFRKGFVQNKTNTYFCRKASMKMAATGY